MFLFSSIYNYYNSQLSPGYRNDNFDRYSFAEKTETPSSFYALLNHARTLLSAMFSISNITQC
jgi:hypothetical protein